MALANLFGWMKAEDKPATAACGTACGAGEKPEEKQQHGGQRAGQEKSR